MDEGIKNRIIIILGILCVILFISTISSCSSAYRQKLARDKEMASRLDTEEKLSNFAQAKSALEKKNDALSRDLESQKKELLETKNSLTQEQLVNKSLNEDLQKVTKLKEKLEENLKEALVAADAAKTKK